METGTLDFRRERNVHLRTELKSCRDLQNGRIIHARLVEYRSEYDKYILSELISMYWKCGSILDARSVFDSILKADVVHWTNLLLGYAHNGDGHVALHLFSKTKLVCAPNSVTYVAVVKACTSLATNGDRKEALERGRKIHLEIGIHLDHCLKNTLVDMYSKCGSMVDAQSVFDGIENPDVVSWTSLLLGYAENGNEQVALNLFFRMRSVGFSPDSVTFLAVLKACTSLAMGGNKKECLQLGRELHSGIGHQIDHYLQNALVDMYSKCDSMADALDVFNSIRKPDVVSWTALILGYVENGDGDIALKFFSRMKGAGCKPNSVTHIGVLQACGLVGALALGKKLHSEIVDFNPHVVTCLVDFYAKCGSMIQAHEVFDLYWNTRNETTWTALIAGYGRFGDSECAFRLFKAMQDKGLQPTAVTFVCLLLCCSHAGLVDKARTYLEAMPVYYGIIPTVKHYTCMVDVLGRRNELHEAIWVIRKMPCNPDAVLWTTLLSACCKWKNAEIGREAFNALAEMDRKNAHPYVLMAQIYGSCGLWEEQWRLAQLYSI